MTFVNLTAGLSTITAKCAVFKTANYSSLNLLINHIPNSETLASGSITLSNLIDLPTNYNYFVEIYYVDSLINITNITCGDAVVTKIINSNEGYACGTFTLLEGQVRQKLSITVDRALTSTTLVRAYIIVWQLGATK